MGGHSARDVYLKLIEAAKRSGKVHRDGVRVVKAQGPLALESKVSSRTLWKALNRLEEWGLCYRDNKDRKPDRAGAFVLRADVSHKGGRDASEGKATTPLQAYDPSDLHLRAPRQRWSSPSRKRQPRYGMVPGTRQVRSKPTREVRASDEELAGVARLGKIRGAVLDALDAAGGTLTLPELCEVLHRSRPRDVRRRVLPMLEEAGIIETAGDVITLAADWLGALERETDQEADKKARRAYERRRDGFRANLAGVSAASLRAIKKSHEARDAGLVAEAERAAAAAKAEEQKRAEAFVRDRLAALGRIRLELLRDVWHGEGGDPWTIPAAVEALGCRVERLPEYENRRFVFPPAEEVA